MAFNNCVTKRGKIDFEKLNQLSKDLDRDFVTLYPITKNKFIHEQGIIGLSINFKDDYSNFWMGLKPFLEDVSELGYNVIELYNGQN